MELFILWVGFFGAWLLVVGPVFQASIELREEAIDRDGIHAVSQQLPPPPRVSPWWWFIPPVAYVLIQRSQRQYREAALAALTPEQREQFVGFRQKARGWLIVAGGACLIAVKETWELAEAYEWWAWVFWVLVFGMPLLCVVYTVNSVVADEKAAGHERPVRRDRREPRDHAEPPGQGSADSDV